ncbi:M42 family metallopeptidase [Lichenifustis flavocetrariae]|uniref:M42 family metallopeptidase n=1 Tax=Lichenifustis flavocetrariae TaxID=2949735 RepID=A0AA41YWC6_9HYPH|nr:M42 family metallopeptidase [Lichenifustis flavocetrariae]MCW6508188.1 M42 family metallopeptidase [Lichenifustis flavocetrariae]
MRAASLEFLKDIVNAPSPSGYEQPAARVYRAYTEAIADRVTTDVHGNVAAVIHPDAPMRIMLAGHMDELGFIIHHIDDEGLLHFQGIGGHDTAVPVGQRVWVYGKQRLVGVIGRTAIHLQDETERKRKPELKDLWIDIGAASRAQAEEFVSLGDVATFQYEFQPLLNDRATARGLDNKMGAFVVAETLRLLKEDGGLHRDVGVYAVATVQEEIGLRGAQTSSFSINAQTGLAVDVNHAIDYPGVSKARHGHLQVGKGPSVSRGPNTNHVTFDLIMQAAREEDIPYQVSVSARGTGTDANAMQLSRGGVATGLLGVPVRYMHTPCELLSLKDVEDCARLMAAYCRRIQPDTDFTPR